MCIVLFIIGFCILTKSEVFMGKYHELKPCCIDLAIAWSALVWDFPIKKKTFEAYKLFIIWHWFGQRWLSSILFPTPCHYLAKWITECSIKKCLKVPTCFPRCVVAFLLFHKSFNFFSGLYATNQIWSQIQYNIHLTPQLCFLQETLTCQGSRIYSESSSSLFFCSCAVFIKAALMVLNYLLLSFL